MVPIRKNREFSETIADKFGVSNIRHKVAKIYGRPDDTLSLGYLETWYYFREKLSFVFHHDELEKIMPLNIGGHSSLGR